MKRRRRKLEIVIVAVIVVFVLVGAGLNTLVQWRLEQQRAGIGEVSDLSALEPLENSTHQTGRFEAHVEYTSVAAPAEASVSTTVTWDDDWFFEDPTVYNHELATTCSVLSAIANSESSYYQAGSGDPAYMENALAALGFDSVSTASYRYRSEILDEIVNFLTNTNDLTAYSIATKQVTSSETGRTKTLVLVSIRGSYGSEWISDANMGDTKADDMDEGTLHLGFTMPALEIIEQLDELCGDLGADMGPESDGIALLVTGHSRGGAVANLVGFWADAFYFENVGSDLPDASSTWCYTFASPNTTTTGATGSVACDNIFNILNPSDIVPTLPLESWGYTRFGHDLWLPELGTEAFEDNYDEMRALFLQDVGVESPYDPGDAATVDEFVRRVGEKVPTVRDLTSASGIVTVVQALLVDMDAMRVLCGHYPSTYIAWMQAIDADELTEG